MGRRVLITGHTGFKGAWLALWLRRLGAHVTGLALDPDPDGIFSACAPWPDIVDRRGDIRDGSSVRSAIAAANPEVVFHLAAQAVVRRGYAEPILTFDTNVMGTVHVLAALDTAPELLSTLVVTSDKVYANPGTGAPLREGDPLGGKDPYSASKASAEHVVSAWASSFKQANRAPVATARAGNVIGGGDSGRDRLIPDILRSLDDGMAVRLRNPDAVRPWQHVLDPVRGYLLYAEHLAVEPHVGPRTLNFGPADAGRTVAQVADALIALCGRGGWVREESPQPAEEPVLALDPSLAASTLDWRCLLDFGEALAWTAEWHEAKCLGNSLRFVAERQIARFGDMTGA